MSRKEEKRDMWRVLVGNRNERVKSEDWCKEKGNNTCRS
jgi:hypothetical protein